MNRLLLILILILANSAIAQEDDKVLIKNTIDVFFKGFHKGDTTLLKSVLHDKLILQTAYKNKEGEDVLLTEEPSKLIQAIANRPDNQKWDERLLAYNIQVDGNMANAWTPYEFWFNDSFSHCGVNSFQLFKQGSNWKIIYLIDTRRRNGCQ